MIMEVWSAHNCVERENTLYGKWKEDVIMVIMKISCRLSQEPLDQHRHVCTHFDAFHMLKSKTDIIFNNFEIFEIL